MKKISMLCSMLLLCATAHAVSTTVYSTTKFRPDDKEGDPDDMFDLDHHYAYTWGISSAVSGKGLNTYSGLKDQLKVGSGWTVDCVTLTFTDIWDWVVEDKDRLWVNLMDSEYKSSHAGVDLKKGVTTFEDNKDDVESTDPGKNYFNGKGTALTNWTATNKNGTTAWDGTNATKGYWTDPNGGNEQLKNTLIFTFTGAQIDKLISYINNGGAVSGNPGYADFGFAFDPDCHYYNTGIELKVVTKKYFVPEGGASVAFLGSGLLALAAFRRRWYR